MERQILDLTGERKHLRKHRGLLKVEGEDGEALVTLDEVEAILVHAREATYSNNLIVELSDRGIPLVFCDQKHQPVAWLWPVSGNFEQAKRMTAQTESTSGLKRKIWARLVKAKIEQQAQALDDLKREGGQALFQIAKRVRPGDPDNMEAHAAGRYWPRLFGENFARSPKQGGINAMLNYGYIVLRSCVARYVVAAGLHPSLGLFHRNQFNAYCLADDLIEPFRPYVDRTVYRLNANGHDNVTPESKEALVEVLMSSVELDNGFVPLSRAVERLAVSLATSFTENRCRLVLPRPGTLLAS